MKQTRWITSFLLKCCWSVICCGIVMNSTYAQLIARIAVESGAYQRTNIPVSVELDPYTVLPAGQLQLQEVQGTQRKQVPFQVEAGKQRRLWFVLDGKNKAGSRRTYELVQVTAALQHTGMRMTAVDNAGTLVLQENDQRLLQYNYATVEPPAGVDSVYRRSGFIHPLWAPDGTVLTNMHPKDHWHHVGIWNPWTHTEFEGKETDFWNLQKKEGTVRFNGFLSRTEGNVWCGFKALQDHIAMQGSGSEKKALNEVWDIRAYNSGTDSSRRIWDFISTFSCAGNSPVELLQYRYGGGFGFRATASWTSATSKVLTSEGKTRLNADSTRARWIKITGRSEQGQAGMLVLCYPDNYDFPQPLRVWPENAERGELMMNYSPTKMKPWQLVYGNEYTQYYRVMVYNGDITVEEAEEAWNAFAKPPVVKVKN